MSTKGGRRVIAAAISGWTALLAAVALAAEWVIAFCRDVRKAGGLRALHAGLTGAKATPETETAQVPAPAPPAPLAACWEPAEHAEVAGEPPWEPAPASGRTGWTREQAAKLNELLNQGAS